MAERKSGTHLTSEKMRDPVQSDSDRVAEYLNHRHAGVLLLIAWNTAKRKDTVLAQCMQVDRLGFELRCHFHGCRYSEERINFPCGPIDNGGKIIDYIAEDMRKGACHVLWPDGPLVKVVLAIYVAITVFYLESHGGKDLRVLPSEYVHLALIKRVCSAHAHVHAYL